MTIFCLTPNPAFDRIQKIPGFKPGEVWRARALTLSPGGKGVNVARAVKTLGGQALCAGFLGGHTGRLQALLMEQEGLESAWTWVDDETRVTVVVVDPESGQTTVLNEEGPLVTTHDWEHLKNDVLRLSAQAEIICVNGSLPRGLSPDLMADLLRSLLRARRKVWVDSSGPTLKACVEAFPAVVKVNSLEAAALLGWREFEDVATAHSAAHTIQQNGISKVILTLGKNGAVLASDAGVWYAKPPALKIVCPIGSGDSFLAGLATAMLNDLTDGEALRHGVAAGSANALSVGGGKFTRQEFDEVLAGTTIKKLAG